MDCDVIIQEAITVFKKSDQTARDFNNMFMTVNRCTRYGMSWKEVLSAVTLSLDKLSE